MKLKYYLRGIGLGIIFATIVMTVSAMVHNNNLSEEKIIEEALKLGMVMPESESEQKDTELQGTEETQQSESQMTSEAESDTQQQEVSDTQQETESQISSEAQRDTEAQEIEIVLTQDTYTSSYGGKVIVNKSSANPTREILMTVKTGATSEDVSEVLYQCGYITDELAFNEFMRVNSYAKRIRTGEKIIPAGSTHADIARILMMKNN